MPLLYALDTFQVVRLLFPSDAWTLCCPGDAMTTCRILCPFVGYSICSSWECSLRFTACRRQWVASSVAVEGVCHGDPAHLRISYDCGPGNSCRSCGDAFALSTGWQTPFWMVLPGFNPVQLLRALCTQFWLGHCRRLLPVECFGPAGHLTMPGSFCLGRCPGLHHGFALPAWQAFFTASMPWRFSGARHWRTFPMRDGLHRVSFLHGVPWLTPLHYGRDDNISKMYTDGLLEMGISWQLCYTGSCATTSL